jgi:hypothetical protein
MQSNLPEQSSMSNLLHLLMSPDWKAIVSTARQKSMSHPTKKKLKANKNRTFFPLIAEKNSCTLIKVIIVKTIETA